MGIADNPGKSWGAVATDMNNDGWLDLFVANDTVANFLFMNRAGRRFEEIGFTQEWLLEKAEKRVRVWVSIPRISIRMAGWICL